MQKRDERQHCGMSPNRQCSIVGAGKEHSQPNESSCKVAKASLAGLLGGQHLGHHSAAPSHIHVTDFQSATTHHSVAATTSHLVVGSLRSRKS